MDSYIVMSVIHDSNLQIPDFRFKKANVGLKLDKFAQTGRQRNFTSDPTIVHAEAYAGSVWIT
jgi:hypothetical protein